MSVRINHALLRVPEKQQQQQQQLSQKQIAVPIGDEVQPGSDPNITDGYARGRFYPFVDFEHMRLSFVPFVKSLGMELVMSFFLSIIVSTVVSLAAIGPDGFLLRAVVVGLTQMVAIFFLYSHRHMRGLERSLDPGLSFLRWIKKDSRTGVYVMILFIAVQYTGSALSAPFLAATGGSAVPNFTATLRPVSLAGAFGIELLVTTMRYFFILFNDQPHKAHTHGRINLNALLAGLGYFASTLISYANGLYLSGNAVMYFGSAINLGFNVPAGSSYFAFALFIVPLVSALLAALLFRLFHNIENLSREELASVQVKQVVQADQEKTTAAKRDTYEQY